MYSLLPLLLVQPTSTSAAKSAANANNFDMRKL